MKKFFKNAGRTVSTVYRNFAQADMLVYSGNAAFFLFMAAFPLAILVLSVLRFFPAQQAELFKLSLVKLLPDIPEISELVTKVTSELSLGSSAFTTVISAVATLFSASTGIFAIMKGLARLYGITRQNTIKYRLIAIGYTLGLLILVILTLGTKLASDYLLMRLGLESHFDADTRENIRWFISFFDYIHLFALIGTFLMAWGLFQFPFEVRIRFRKLIPGALFTSVGWFLASKIFTFCVTRLWNFSRIYGSLTAVILLSLWIYVLMAIFFIGASVSKAYGLRSVSAKNDSAKGV